MEHLTVSHPAFSMLSENEAKHLGAELRRKFYGCDNTAETRDAIAAHVEKFLEMIDREHFLDPNRTIESFLP